jgi:hypothetical protein
MKHLKRFISALVLFVALSCTKNQVDDNGKVSFTLSSNLEIADQTRSNVSQFTTLPASGDFILTITDSSEELFWTGKLSEWNAETIFPAGNYSVSAVYGNIEEEGFDKPYFTGTADFVVTGGQTTPVPISVTLGNTVIYISCTDNFKDYYADYNFNLVRSQKTIATFTKDETKAAFVDGYKISIQGTLQGAGSPKTFTKDYSGLKAATAYKMLFDVTNVGGTSITITFNDNVETVELGDFELND